MGKKKSRQEHVQQSMGQMVSNAALSRLGPKIEEYVAQAIRRLGSQLAMQQASTLETLFSRIIVLETIVMDKLGYTQDDLATKVSELEDSKEGYALAETVEKGDLVRVAVKTRAKDQTEFQGESRAKIYNTGTGETLGTELEDALVGLKTGEVKTVEFGQDKAMVAEFTINRVSRLVAQEPKNEQNPVAGQ